MRVVVLLCATLALRRKTALRVRGGDMTYLDDEDEEEPPIEEEFETTASGDIVDELWRSRLDRLGVRKPHPSQDRFKADFKSPHFLSPQATAKLLGTAVLAFERAHLSQFLTSLPKVSRGARLVMKNAAAVQEALAGAVAESLGARFVALDEQRLRKLRREAQELAGAAVSKEDAIASLCRIARDEPMIVWFRDDCVLRSRGAAAALLKGLEDGGSRAWYVFATARRKDEPAVHEEEEQTHEEEDEESPVTGMFERALKELATRVASQARRSPDHPYLEALGEALSDESMLKALADSWVPMLRDRQVKVRVELVPTDKKRAKQSPSKLRDVLRDNKPSREGNIPQSLLHWMNKDGQPEQTTASSSEAQSLIAALDTVVIDEPANSDARVDWTRWARDERKKAVSRKNVGILRNVLNDSGLRCEHLNKVVDKAASFSELNEDDAKAGVLEAMRIQLASASEFTGSLDPATLAAGLAAVISPGSSSSSSETTTEQPPGAEPQDKHERALASHVVSPTDVGVTYDTIGGLEDAKRALREAITYPLKYPRLYNEGVAAEAVKGVLLFGPPGTGKTMLAKAVATEGGANFLSIDASAIENKWLGESEKNAKAVFSLARRLAPCVVFLDEIDSLLSSREGGDDTSHGTLTSVKTTLMQEWDGLRTTTDRVVVIGSTNRPYDLDEAVLRRMPRRILVDLPDASTRAEILRVTLRHNRLAPDVNLTKIAAKLDGYSGSDVKEVCREAVVSVANSQAAKLDAINDARSPFLAQAQDLRPVCAADFDAAISKLKSSVAEHGPEMTRVHEWNQQYGEVKKKAAPPAASLYL